MQLRVIHDSNGNIAALVAYSPDSPPAYPEIKPGEHMIEIEAPAEITLDLDALQLHKRLSDLIQNHRVEVASGKPGLTRKS